LKDTLKLRWLAVLAALLFIAMVTVNALANILPLNGISTGVLSDNIPNLFVPAGITFAVWGVIYLLLLGYCAAFLGSAFRRPPKAGWATPEAVIFSLNAAFNTAWIFAWHWQKIGISLILMFGILTSLIALMERNHRAMSALPPAQGGPEKLRRFLLRNAILVYLGWICVATIANFTAWLVTIGWDGFGISPLVWTIVALLAATAIAVLLLVRSQAAGSALVFLWAYLGIILKRAATDPAETRPIIIAATIGMGIIALTMVATLLVRKKAAG